jgi:midasin
MIHDDDVKKDDKKREREGEKQQQKKKRKDDPDMEYKEQMAEQFNEDNDDNMEEEHDSNIDDEDNDNNDDDVNDMNDDSNTKQGILHTNQDFNFASDKRVEMSINDDELDESQQLELTYETVRSDDMTEARNLWSLHKASSENHSVRLCEQLRLILEPTLATRLSGDYRAGKRIHMRRVINYIASGFRKDKIWLRRTKPAKRDYQIMLMIDNSSSMGEAGPVALSSLATISNALSASNPKLAQAPRIT